MIWKTLSDGIQSEVTFGHAAVRREAFSEWWCENRNFGDKNQLEDYRVSHRFRDRRSLQRCIAARGQSFISPDSIEPLIKWPPVRASQKSDRKTLQPRARSALLDSSSCLRKSSRS